MGEGRFLLFMMWLRTGHRCRRALPVPRPGLAGGLPTENCPVCGLLWNVRPVGRHSSRYRWELWVDDYSGRPLGGRTERIYHNPLADWGWSRFRRRT